MLWGIVFVYIWGLIGVKYKGRFIFQNIVSQIWIKEIIVNAMWCELIWYEYWYMTKDS